MLKFGFFENFKGADTRLIWGDTDGLSQLRDLFRRLSTRAITRVALRSAEWAVGLQDIKVDLEMTQGKGGDLRVGRDATGIAILASYSAEQFAEFAEKIGFLAEPECPNGHHYFDAPGTAHRQIIVSKGEYPPSFGSEVRARV